METILPKTLIEAVRYYNEPSFCDELLAKARWPDGAAPCSYDSLSRQEAKDAQDLQVLRLQTAIQREGWDDLRGLSDLAFKVVYLLLAFSQL